MNPLTDFRNARADLPVDPGVGTYTQIASLSRFSVANQRRRGPRLDAPERDERTEEERAPFFCPACGDGSIVASDCGRCGVAMHPSEGAIVLPQSSPSTADHKRSLLLLGLILFTACGTPALMLGSLALMDQRQYGASPTTALAWGSALAIGAAVVFVLAVLLALGPRLVARPKKSVRRRRAARRRRSAVERRALEAWADEASPVRLRGRVRVSNERLVIEDESGRVRVRLGPEVRVYDADGERSVLCEGEEVEVVGVGQRVLGAGHGYRDARGELELDGSRPLEVWVA